MRSSALARSSIVASISSRIPTRLARGADALLLLTEWKEYRELDWKRIYGEMARPLILDARNMLSPAKMKELGFEYHSFGRPDLSASPALVSS